MTASEVQNPALPTPASAEAALKSAELLKGMRFLFRPVKNLHLCVIAAQRGQDKLVR